MMMTETTLHVIQGEFLISDRPDVMLTTVLGSCISACIYDPVFGIGGMNHYLLPDATSENDLRFASAAMEQLVNGLLKGGASRGHLQAKLFGGARTIASLPDIGHRNGDAALNFLAGEHIPCVAMSIGGGEGRRVRFWPTTGRAQQQLLGKTLKDPAVPVPPPRNQIELF